jgi:hypothetical protein
MTQAGPRTASLAASLRGQVPISPDDPSPPVPPVPSVPPGPDLPEPPVWDPPGPDAPLPGEDPDPPPVGDPPDGPPVRMVDLGARVASTAAARSRYRPVRVRLKSSTGAAIYAPMPCGYPRPMQTEVSGGAGVQRERPEAAGARAAERGQWAAQAADARRGETRRRARAAESALEAG